jgi:hypothetical protein
MSDVLIFMKNYSIFKGIIGRFKKIGTVANKSIILNLYKLYKAVPGYLLWVEGEELYYNRKEIIKFMNEEDKYFQMTSFERSLKRFGMTVKQSTHSKSIKIWKFRTE